jgi:hypothetical protein
LKLEVPYKENNFLNVGLLPSQEGNYSMHLKKNIGVSATNISTESFIF